MSIQTNWETIQHNIQKACQQAGRQPCEVTILAATKTQTPENILQAAHLGIREFGENRVQELLAKKPLLPAEFRWNMIGHLQKNKVKYIIDDVKCIQSVESETLLKEIQRLAQQHDVIMPILLEVNISGEDSKFGLAPQAVAPFVEETLAHCNRLRIRGLMTLAAFETDEARLRPQFAAMRRLFEDLQGRYPELQLDTLSMGMSNDYPLAIQEGATMVRIGSALFGQRL